MTGRRIVILGNGGAAICAAKAARASGHQGEIHLVSDTNAPAFNPMLSPYYLKGAIPWERCFPFGIGFYRDYDVTCHVDAAAEFLDAISQRVVLANGEQLPYDRCLIATGADPTIPAVPGLKDSPRAIPLRTAASARNLEKATRSAKRVVVLGASLVGLKVAEILCKRNIRVILLDVVDQLLPRGAHPLCAALLRRYFEEHGVDVRLGCAMEGMEGAKEGVLCHFPESIVEEADFVAVCTGVHPNLSFLDPRQAAVDKAILVNERMQTSTQNLYAAGDASQGMNLLSGQREWLGNWGNACFQGRTAGENMAGKPVSYAGSLPENISPFFDWTYAHLGDVQREGKHVRHVAFGDPGQGGYCLLAFEQGVLIGANLINATHLAGKLRRVIIRKLDWGEYLEHADERFTVHGIEKMLSGITDSISQLPVTGPRRRTYENSSEQYGRNHGRSD
jgi:NADPH-dependent 2,4-dienoyl-CoA reductase/sulfur reductase-like enzyme